MPIWGMEVQCDDPCKYPTECAGSPTLFFADVLGIGTRVAIEAPKNFRTFGDAILLRCVCPDSEGGLPLCSEIPCPRLFFWQAASLPLLACRPLRPWCLSYRGTRVEDDFAQL